MGFPIGVWACCIFPQRIGPFEPESSCTFGPHKKRAENDFRYLLLLSKEKKKMYMAKRLTNIGPRKWKTTAIAPNNCPTFIANNFSFFFIAHSLSLSLSLPLSLSLCLSHFHFVCRLPRLAGFSSSITQRETIIKKLVSSLSRRALSVIFRDGKTTSNY